MEVIMKRSSEEYLLDWLGKDKRKPLVIRGARQVGKSTLVRQFSESQNLRLIEVNLEKYVSLDKIFKTCDIDNIIREIEALTGIDPRQEGVLLFLDEIQATPNAVRALRYFYEEMPNLPVIAAGSLLEFTLANHNFSMPVGRIEYFHLGPMSFKEFLVASNEPRLVKYIDDFGFGEPIPEIAHQRLLDKQREYLFIGGMPESVLTYIQTSSITKSRDVHRSIIQTYRDDFAKYATQSELARLQHVFDVLPQMVGRKIKYSNISQHDRSSQIKSVIDLLIKARLYTPAYHSDCSGAPLRSGINEKVYKLYFLDIGLLNYIQGVDWKSISILDNRALINEGILAEQYIAQHLAYRFKGLELPELFYWLREGKAGNAEVDFVISKGLEIIPVEVKAGKSGGLKSLQQFLLSKKRDKAFRLDLNLPSVQNLSYQTQLNTENVSVSFKLFSLPIYLIESLLDLI